MNPKLKQLLSTALVAAFGAVLPQIGDIIAHMAPVLVPVFSAVILAVVHYVPALGTKEVVVASMLNGNEGKTVDVVLSKELKEPKVPTGIDG